jgi:cytochrome P450
MRNRAFCEAMVGCLRLLVDTEQYISSLKPRHLDISSNDVVFFLFDIPQLFDREFCFLDLSYCQFHICMLVHFEILIAVQLIIRFITKGIYRVYFHPLSKFSGPKTHAATRFPYLLATWKGKPHKFLSTLHEEYGSVVRIAPDELSFIDADAWKDIYGHNTKTKVTRGSVPHKHWGSMAKPVNGTPSLIAANDADHTRMRRLFNPAFSDRALKLQEPLFMKYVNLLAEKIHEGIQHNVDHKFDMVKLYNFTTFDVMGDLTFGEPLHMLSQGKYDPWVSIIFAFVKSGTRMSIMRHYPLLEKAFKAMIPKSLTQKQMDHFNFSQDRVTKRLEKGRVHDGVDIWDLVLNQSGEKGLSRSEMDSNAGTFMAAGTETTATLLSGLTSLLLENPSTMTQLTKEIRDAFLTSSEMSIERCASLPYLNACIKEALRLYPPLVIGRTRMTPSDGSTICGQFVPPGVGVSQCSRSKA